MSNQTPPIPGSAKSRNTALLAAKIGLKIPFLIPHIAISLLAWLLKKLNESEYLAPPKKAMLFGLSALFGMPESSVPRSLLQSILEYPAYGLYLLVKFALSDVPNYAYQGVKNHFKKEETLPTSTEHVTPDPTPASTALENPTKEDASETYGLFALQCLSMVWQYTLGSRSVRMGSTVFKPLITGGSTMFAATGLLFFLYKQFGINLGIETNSTGLNITNSSDPSSDPVIVNWGIGEIIIISFSAASFAAMLMSRVDAMGAMLNKERKASFIKSIGFTSKQSETLALKEKAAVISTSISCLLSGYLGALTLAIRASAKEHGTSENPICVYGPEVTAPAGLIGAVIAYHPFEAFVCGIFKEHVAFYNSLKSEPGLQAKLGFSGMDKADWLVLLSTEAMYAFFMLHGFSGILECYADMPASTANDVAGGLSIAFLLVGMRLTVFGRIFGHQLGRDHELNKRYSKFTRAKKWHAIFSDILWEKHGLLTADQQQAVQGKFTSLLTPEIMLEAATEQLAELARTTTDQKMRESYQTAKTKLEATKETSPAPSSIQGEDQPEPEQTLAVTRTLMPIMNVFDKVSMHKGSIAALSAMLNLLLVIDGLQYTATTFLSIFTLINVPLAPLAHQDDTFSMDNPAALGVVTTVSLLAAVMGLAYFIPYSLRRSSEASFKFTNMLENSNLGWDLGLGSDITACANSLFSCCSKKEGDSLESRPLLDSNRSSVNLDSGYNGQHETLTSQL